MPGSAMVRLTRSSGLCALIGVVGCGGDPKPATTDPEPVTLVTDPVTLDPGAEDFYCQDFVNPFQGEPAFVRAFDSTIVPSPHHMVLFYVPDITANAPPAPCSPFEFQDSPYGTVRSRDAVVFPPGVAMRIAAGGGFRVQLHHLNPTQQPIDASTRVTLHRVDPSAIREEAGTLYARPDVIDVPPHTTQTVTIQCIVPADMNFVQVLGHTHRHGVHVVASAAGRTFLDAPGVVTQHFDPPLHVSAGDALQISCTYDNTEDFTLNMGPSDKTEEMCVFSGEYFPVPGTLARTARCQ